MGTYVGNRGDKIDWYDGVWAPWWYASAHASSGWGTSGERKGMTDHEKAAKIRPARPHKSVPFELQDLLAECGPWFATLRSNAMQISPSSSRSDLQDKQDAETCDGPFAPGLLEHRLSVAGA